MPRRPEVTIIGAIRLTAEEGQTFVTATYGFKTDDLRPPFSHIPRVTGTAFAARIPPIDVTPRPGIVWSGDGTPLRPNAEVTGFQFDTTDTHAGEILIRRVAVRILDSDGLTASDELIVRIHITPVPSEEDDFPPICKNKPWLPECEAAMARVSTARKRSNSITSTGR